MHRLRARLRTDDGAIAILIVVAIPVVMAMLGYGSEVLVTTGADRELQRTADAAALAAAAQIPVADLGAVDTPVGQALADLEGTVDGLLGQVDAAAQVPDTGIDGVPSGPVLPAGAGVDLPGLPVLTATDVAERGCAIAEPAAAESTLLAAFARGGAPTCTAADGGTPGITVTPRAATDDVLDHLEQFLGAHAALPPVPVTPPAELSPVTDLVTGATTDLQDVAKATVAMATAGIDVDLPALLPAVSHPEVEVTATAAVGTPLRRAIVGDDEAPSEMTATAVARRRFKNVLVLPVVDACVEPPSLPGLDDLPLPELPLPELPLPAIPPATGLLGTGTTTFNQVEDPETVEPPTPPGAPPAPPAAPSEPPAAPSEPTVPTEPPTVPTDPPTPPTEPPAPPTEATDPLVDAIEDTTGLDVPEGATCTVDVNPHLDAPLADAMAEVDALADRIRTLPLAGATHLADAVDALATDLRDVADPPGTGPTQRELLADMAAAGTDGEGVLVVLVRSTGIPLLDAAVVPAREAQQAVAAVEGRDVQALAAELSDVARTTTEARGAFRAELVRGGGA